MPSLWQNKEAEKVIWLEGSEIIMWIAFCIALGIVLFGAFNYDKMSYKATYYRNKKNDVGYYWGGKPRNEKTVKRTGWKEVL